VTSGLSIPREPDRTAGASRRKRRRCEQARQPFEREEAATAKEREALRRLRKQWEQTGAEYRYERDHAEPRG